MKKSLAVLLSIMIILTMSLTSYAQVSDIGTHWASQEISYLIKRGVLDGYPDGTFKPDKPMTKVEFYKIVNELSNLVPNEPSVQLK